MAIVTLTAADVDLPSIGDVTSFIGNNLWWFVPIVEADQFFEIYETAPNRFKAEPTDYKDMFGYRPEKPSKVPKAVMERAIYLASKEDAAVFQNKAGTEWAVVGDDSYYPADFIPYALVPYGYDEPDDVEYNFSQSNPIENYFDERRLQETGFDDPADVDADIYGREHWVPTLDDMSWSLIEVDGVVAEYAHETMPLVVKFDFKGVLAGQDGKYKVTVLGEELPSETFTDEFDIIGTLRQIGSAANVIIEKALPTVEGWAVEVFPRGTVDIVFTHTTGTQVSFADFEDADGANKAPVFVEPDIGKEYKWGSIEDIEAILHLINKTLTTKSDTKPASSVTYMFDGNTYYVDNAFVGKLTQVLPALQMRHKGKGSFYVTDDVGNVIEFEKADGIAWKGMVGTAAFMVADNKGGKFLRSILAAMDKAGAKEVKTGPSQVTEEGAVFAAGDVVYKKAEDAHYKESAGAPRYVIVRVENKGAVDILPLHADHETNVRLATTHTGRLRKASKDEQVIHFTGKYAEDLKSMFNVFTKGAFARQIGNKEDTVVKGTILPGKVVNFKKLTDRLVVLDVDGELVDLLPLSASRPEDTHILNGALKDYELNADQRVKFTGERAGELVDIHKAYAKVPKMVTDLSDAEARTLNSVHNGTYAPTAEALASYEGLKDQGLIFGGSGIDGTPTLTDIGRAVLRKIKRTRTIAMKKEDLPGYQKFHNAVLESMERKNVIKKGDRRNLVKKGDMVWMPYSREYAKVTSVTKKTVNVKRQGQTTVYPIDKNEDLYRKPPKEVESSLRTRLSTMPFDEFKERLERFQAQQAGEEEKQRERAEEVSAMDAGAVVLFRDAWHEKYGAEPGTTPYAVASREGSTLNLVSMNGAMRFLVPTDRVFMASEQAVAFDTPKAKVVYDLVQRYTATRKTTLGPLSVVQALGRNGRPTPRRYVVTDVSGGNVEGVALSGGGKGSRLYYVKVRDVVLAADQSLEFSGASVDTLTDEFRRAIAGLGKKIDEEANEKVATDEPVATPTAKPASKGYRYGVRNRPIGFGGTPKGHTSTETHPAFKHGVIVFDEPLDVATVRGYELALIPTEADVDKIVNDVVDSLAEYADEYVEDSEEDPTIIDMAVGGFLDNDLPVPTFITRDDIRDRVMEGLRKIVQRGEKSAPATPTPSPGPTVASEPPVLDWWRRTLDVTQGTVIYFKVEATYGTMTVMFADYPQVAEGEASTYTAIYYPIGGAERRVEGAYDSLDAIPGILDEHWDLMRSMIMTPEEPTPSSEPVSVETAPTPGAEPETQEEPSEPATGLIQIAGQNVLDWVSEWKTDDYPYGRERTTARWFIEGTPGKQRIGRITVNPNTGRENKAKYTIYHHAVGLAVVSDDRAYTVLQTKSGRLNFEDGAFNYKGGIIRDKDPERFDAIAKELASLGGAVKGKTPEEESRANRKKFVSGMKSRLEKHFGFKLSVRTLNSSNLNPSIGIRPKNNTDRIPMDFKVLAAQVTRHSGIGVYQTEIMYSYSGWVAIMHKLDGTDA